MKTFASSSQKEKKRKTSLKWTQLVPSPLLLPLPSAIAVPPPTPAFCSTPLLSPGDMHTRRSCTRGDRGARRRHLNGALLLLYNAISLHGLARCHCCNVSLAASCNTHSITASVNLPRHAPEPHAYHLSTRVSTSHPQCEMREEP